MNDTTPTTPTTPTTTTSSTPPVALDRKTFWIGVMCVIFAVLAGLHAVRPDAMAQPVNAAMMGETVDSRDYQLVTALQTDGNEALYILDKRSGQLAILLWNAQAQRPVVADIKPVMPAFR